MTVAYSYLRFSSKKQSDGDSVRRQTEARDRWLARTGIPLADAFVDAGVSGFRGRHRGDRNDLGRFLALVESGRVAPGSYLLVENLDRLSREEVQKGVSLLLSIIDAGVRVVVFMPAEMTFATPVDMTSLILAVVELSRANAESQHKSDRVAAAWAQKRRAAAGSGAVMTSMAPLWLRRSPGGGFEAVPERAAAVRRAFELAAGGWGIHSIIRKLDEEGHACFGRSGRWKPAYLHLILTSRRVLGEMQPCRRVRDPARPRGWRREPHGDPVAGYFPRVVEDEVFYRAQEGIRQRRRHRGRRSRHGVNLFAGLMAAADGGDTYEFRHFQAVPRYNRKARDLYVNTHFRGGVVPLSSFPAAALEAAVLDSLREVSPDAVFPPDTDGRSAAAASELADVRARLKAVEDRIVAGDALDTLLSAAAKLERRAAELAAEVAAAGAGAAAGGLAETRTLAAALAAAPDREAAKLRLQQELRKVVAGLDCLFLRDGTRQIAVVQVRFRGSEATRVVAVRFRSGNAGRGGYRLGEYVSWDTLTAADLPAEFDLRREPQRRRLEGVLRRLLRPENWLRRFEPDRVRP